MTLRIAYIGEVETGLGFQLAGAQTYSPDAERSAVLDSIRAARGDSDIVLLDFGLSTLVRDELESMLVAQPIPPVVAVPGMKSDQALSGEVLARARRVLGIG